VKVGLRRRGFAVGVMGIGFRGGTADPGELVVVRVIGAVLGDAVWWAREDWSLRSLTGLVAGVGIVKETSRLDTAHSSPPPLVCAFPQCAL